MDNTRDELLDLIRNATNIDMICFFALIYVVAPDFPPLQAYCHPWRTEEGN